MKKQKEVLIAGTLALVILLVGVFMVFDININFNFLRSENISVDRLATILNEDYQFVDIRTSDEYYGSTDPSRPHINEFTYNLDYYQFRNDLSMLDGLDKNKTTVIICRTGSRTSDAINIMKDYGFKDVLNVLGGMVDWDNR
jgi:rhodanese-related sulfurtransferase